MNKEKFVAWLDEKIHQLTYDTPEKHLDKDIKVQLLRGHILAMKEIKNQVENGKFDT